MLDLGLPCLGQFQVVGRLGVFVLIHSFTHFLTHSFLHPFIHKHSPTPQTCSGKQVFWGGKMLSPSVILSSGTWGARGSLSDLH